MWPLDSILCALWKHRGNTEILADEELSYLIKAYPFHSNLLAAGQGKESAASDLKTNHFHITYIHAKNAFT